MSFSEFSCILCSSNNSVSQTFFASSKISESFAESINFTVTHLSSVTLTVALSLFATSKYFSIISIML